MQLLELHDPVAALHEQRPADGARRQGRQLVQQHVRPAGDVHETLGRASAALGARVLGVVPGQGGEGLAGLGAGLEAVELRLQVGAQLGALGLLLLARQAGHGGRGEALEDEPHLEAAPLAAVLQRPLALDLAGGHDAVHGGHAVEVELLLDLGAALGDAPQGAAAGLRQLVHPARAVAAVGLLDALGDLRLDPGQGLLVHVVDPQAAGAALVDPVLDEARREQLPARVHEPVDVGGAVDLAAVEAQHDVGRGRLPAGSRFLGASRRGDEREGKQKGEGLDEHRDQRWVSRLERCRRRRGTGGRTAWRTGLPG